MSNVELVNQLDIKLEQIHSSNYQRTLYVACIIQDSQVDNLKRGIVPQEVLDGIKKKFDNEKVYHDVTPLMVGSPKDFTLDMANKIYKDPTDPEDMVWRRTGDFKNPKTGEIYKADTPKSKGDVPMWSHYIKSKVLFKENVVDRYKDVGNIGIFILTRRGRV